MGADRSRHLAAFARRGARAHRSPWLQAAAAAAPAPVHERARGAADALQRRRAGTAGRARAPDRRARARRPLAVRIHQLLSAAGPFDAVTRQALAYNDLFASWGIAGDIYASAIEPRLPEPVHALHRLHPRPEDLLLIHYSAYAPRLEPTARPAEPQAARLPQRHARSVPVELPAARRRAVRDRARPSAALRAGGRRRRGGLRVQRARATRGRREATCASCRSCSSPDLFGAPEPQPRSRAAARPERRPAGAAQAP